MSFFTITNKREQSRSRFRPSGINFLPPLRKDDRKMQIKVYYFLNGKLGKTFIEGHLAKGIGFIRINGKFFVRRGYNPLEHAGQTLPDDAVDGLPEGAAIYQIKQKRMTFSNPRLLEALGKFFAQNKAAIAAGPTPKPKRDSCSQDVPLLYK